MKNPLFFSVFVAMAAVSSSAKADLLVNGNFESGPNSGWATANLETGPGEYNGILKFGAYPTGVPAATGGSNGAYYASLSDDQLAGTIPGHGQVAELSQMVGTTSGQMYNLSFSTYIEIPSDSSYPTAPGLLFQADWNGTPLLNIVNPTFLAPNAWQSYTFQVQGTGNDTVSFFGANAPKYSGLDNVSLSLTSTPLPGNLTTCGIAAMLGLGVFVYRRRRQACAA